MDFEENYYEPNFDSDRKQCIEWAKNILEKPFLILDTETAGLDSDSEAVEIGIINYLGEIIFSSRIKPLKPVPAAATAIHGITNEMLCNAPLFVDIYQDLKTVIESQKVFIYNAIYDRGILYQQCKTNNLPWFQMDSECVMGWYSQYCGNWNDYHQSYTWQKLPGGDHSALGDCLATLKVIKDMAGHQ
jgi:DNA polymerase III subunit epsilon